MEPIYHSGERVSELSQYVLPLADQGEQERLVCNSFVQHRKLIFPAVQIEPGLNLQHRLIVSVVDGKLSMAPISLHNGDRVLESVAGTSELFPFISYSHE